VNFDILGGMTSDEWLAEENTSGARHATREKKESETYEMLRNKKLSAKQSGQWTASPTGAKRNQ